jgi:hypothetical protein
MKYEAPGAFGSEPKELPPAVRSSGSLGSSLNKSLQKDTKIPPEKKWIKDLIHEIPHNQLPVVTEFLKNFPDRPEEAARELFDVIHNMAQGILRSPDQKAALQECLEETKKRLEN